MREAVDRLIVNSQNDIAGPQSGVVGRAITIDADDRNFTFFIVGSLVAFWWVHLVIDVILLVLFILVRQKAAPTVVAAE